MNVKARWSMVDGLQGSEGEDVSGWWIVMAGRSRVSGMEQMWRCLGWVGDWYLEFEGVDSSDGYWTVIAEELVEDKSPKGVTTACAVESKERATKEQSERYQKAGRE